MNERLKHEVQIKFQAMLMIFFCKFHYINDGMIVFVTHISRKSLNFSVE